MKTLIFDNSAGRLEWMTPIAHINDIKEHVAALENRIPVLESQNVTMRRALDAIVGLLHTDAQRKGGASLEATIGPRTDGDNSAAGDEMPEWE